MKRKRLFALAAVFGVTLVCGILVEGVLRVYAHTADSPLATALLADPFDVLVEPHGEAGYRPRPGMTFTYDNGAEAHTNTAGYRGPLVEESRAPGTFRVVLLGGSTTFGWGVDDAETIDRHMSRILDARWPSRSWEILNLAFDGYDSYQLLERFRTDVVPLRPHAVIVNSGVNDVSHAWLTDIQDGDRRNTLYLSTLDQLRLEAEQGGPTLWTRTKHWLYAARAPGWIRTTMRRGREARLATEIPPRTPHWEYLDYFERNLDRLAREAGAAGVEVVLFSTPPSSLLTKYEPTDLPVAYYWINDAATTQIYRDSLDVRMRGLSDSLGGEGLVVRYVPHEVLPAELFLDDAHLTSEGNRLVAEDFVEALGPWIRGAGEREDGPG